MGAFLSKYSHIFIWISSLAIIGAIAVLILQLNNSFLPTTTSIEQPAPASGGAAVPALPADPSVSFVIQKDANGSSFVIRWSDLPGNTTALNIFRSKKDSNIWQLWKTIQISANDLLNGNATIDLGGDTSAYSYYVQAVNSDGNTSSTILWTSPPGQAPTGTPPAPGTGGNNGPVVIPTSSNPNPPPPSGNNPPPPNPTSTTSTGNDNGSNSNGDVYYNSQIQIAGYGSPSGDFWVKYVNQNIEIGWQNLPANTDSIVVSRSQTGASPWNQLLREENPALTGTYSLQLVDSTLGDPYYYLLTAYSGTTVVGNFGPAYLPSK